jgi:prophage antirepressor-like protein
VDVYNGLLKYKGRDIVIVIDNNNEAWFYAKQIAVVLGYNDQSARSIVREYVDEFNKVTYETIKVHDPIAVEWYQLRQQDRAF